MKRRDFYVLLIIITIILGLSSRKFFAPTSMVFQYVGDILWATMFFFIFRFLFIHKNHVVNSLITIAWCFLIEISQLYQGEWINGIRKTILGALILGSGFLWSDLVCYIIGVIIGLAFDCIFVKKAPN